MAKQKQLSPAGAQRKWISELTASKTELKKFTEQGHKTSKAYLDVRGDHDKNDYKFNLFNVNVNQLRDALFARIPKPSVARTYNDVNDPVGRTASTILQRNLMLEMNEQSGQADDFKNMIKDRLIAGLACAWVRYVPTYTTEEQFSLSEDVEDETAELDEASEVLKDERCPIEYVNWQDILWSPARVWSEVRWVARRAYLTVDEFEEKFPDAEEIQGHSRDESESGIPKTDDPNGVRNNIQKEIEVWEIWDKTRLKIYFVREGATEVLDVKGDPYGLPHFFPCPQFLMGDSTTSNFIPQSDYVNAQDTYKRVNDIVARIAGLVAQAKARGVYNGDMPELEDLLNPNIPEGTMFAVEKWGDLQQTGGLKGAVDWVPLTEFITGIQMLRSELAATQKELNSLTGIPDIMQGATSPYETNGAQQLKAGYAGGRMQSLQIEVAEFFSQLMQIKAFLMVKFYEPERLVQRSGSLMPQDQQFLQSAIQLLKNQLLSNIAITVSVDALARQNAMQDTQERTQFISTLGNFVGQAPPEMQQKLMPMMMKGVQWLAAAMPGTEEFQGVIDETIQQVTQEAQAPKDDKDAQSKQEAMQMQERALQQEKDKAQFEAQQEQAKAEFNAEIDKKKAEVEVQKLQMKITSEEKMKSAELKLKELELVHQGIDTSEVELPLGDANASMRLGKDDVLNMFQQQMQMLMQQQHEQALMQAQQAQQNAQMLQEAFAQAMQTLANTPMPPATITTYRDVDGNLKGVIKSE